MEIMRENVEVTLKVNNEPMTKVNNEPMTPLVPPPMGSLEVLNRLMWRCPDLRPAVQAVWLRKPRARLNLATALNSRLDWQMADRVIDAMLELPDCDDQLALLGAAVIPRYVQGRIEAGRAAVRAIWEAMPSPEMAEQFSQILRRFEDWAEAGALLYAAMLKHENHSRLLAQRTWVAAESGDDLASTWVARLARLDPSHPCLPSLRHRVGLAVTEAEARRGWSALPEPKTAMAWLEASQDRDAVISTVDAALTNSDENDDEAWSMMARWLVDSDRRTQAWSSVQDVVATHREAAWAHWARFELAVDLGRSAEDIERASVGVFDHVPFSKAVADAMVRGGTAKLGGLCRMKGYRRALRARWSEAFHWYALALRILDEVGGDEAHRRSAVHAAWASTLVWAGRPVEATAHAEQGAILRQAAGLGHDYLGISEAQLARVFVAQGDPERAIPHAERAVSLLNGHPEDVAHRVSAWIDLASAHRARGAFDEATCAWSLARDAISVGPVMEAELWLEAAKMPGADRVALTRRAWEAREAHYPTGHWFSGAVLTELAEAHMASGEVARGAELCADALEIFDVIGRPTHPMFVRAHLVEADVRRHRGEVQGAAAWYDKAERLVDDRWFEALVLRERIAASLRR